jgi:predicted negative regulator of RcsB-dependent stress response
MLINLLYAKKDFYYSFINSSGDQISEKRKQTINDGFDLIANARELSKEGKIDDAYTQIKIYKEKNTVKVLSSDLMILFAELSLKKEAKRFSISASKELEKAINSSLISEFDLPKAYMLLVELKLKTNKTKDAKYFAQIIINNFDNELTKTYGKIYLAKVYKYQRTYSKAIKILSRILSKTNNKLIATIVADELFDVYIANKNIEKANELISKVLKTNIDYYANDSFLANKKISKLIKSGMPDHAVEILKELLNRTTKESSIEDFKYKLANTYMLMYDKTNFYLEKAKELYKDILNDYSQGAYAKKSKMYIDEILMRQGRIKPGVVAAKYKSSASMQQKALLQELLNDKEDKKYKLILKAKKVYKKISNKITNRFGYESVATIFDEVNIEQIKNYLNNGKCFELNKALKTSRSETLEKLIEDESIKYKFFECLIEVPYERGYLKVKSTFSKSRDANIYLYLERMAFGLKLIDESLDHSAKVEMVDNQDVLAQEFLYRYQILKSKGEGLSLDKFLSYANKNTDFIDFNKNNPIIVDFYYDYYLYLLKKDQKEKANDILKNLYLKQKEMKAYIYSPFVETELSKLEKDKSEFKKSLAYLLEALENTRRIKPNDEIKTYYDILKLYDVLGNTLKKDEYLNKCKNTKNTKESLYKKMCDEM